MMLSALENIPKTPTDWDYFTWNHRDSHDRIRAAIQAQFSINLRDYQIEPIDPDNINQFLENNQSLHAEMDAVLGLQSSDLQDVNLRDEKQLESWIRLNYLEHFYAETKLMI